MNTSIHLIITGADEIIPVVGERSVTPMVQFYHQDMVGGPVSITFGDWATPAEGSDLCDRLIDALMTVRAEFTKRIVSGSRIVALPGAGDPRGESPDAPVLSDDDR